MTWRSVRALIPESDRAQVKQLKKFVEGIWNQNYEKARIMNHLRFQHLF